MNQLITDADGTITRVRFYDGGTLLYMDSTSPYSYTLANSPAANYSFIVKATDDKGLTSSSATVAVGVSMTANQAPLVNITSPTHNALYYAPGSITINAAAIDADDSVNNVKFYNGATLLKTDSTSPYSGT